MGAVTVGEIRVNARFNTASFVSDASKLNATAKQTSADIKNSFDRVDFAESNEGARLLNELLQTHLPRGLTRLISQLPGLGAAFSSALPVIAVAVFAQKIVELVEHISNASEAAKKAAGEYGEFAQATERNAQSIALENLKLEDQLRVLQGKPSKNGPAIAMEEARLKAEELTSQIQKAIDKEKELLKSNLSGSGQAFLAIPKLQTSWISSRKAKRPSRSLSGKRAWHFRRTMTNWLHPCKKK